jgi:S1-C subfamily serine protease
MLRKVMLYITAALAVVAGAVVLTTAASVLQAEPVLTRHEMVQQARESSVMITRDGSTGSGVVIASGGRIITNAHVCGTSDELAVTRWNDVAVQAKVMWVGKIATYDLCLIDVADEYKKADEFVVQIEWRPAPFLTGRPVVGEEVMHIGNPMGIREVISFGTIGRMTTGHNEQPAIGYIGMAGPGSSGGGVFDMSGFLVGLIYSGSQVVVPSRGFRAARIPLGVAHVIPASVIEYLLAR